MAAPFGGHPTLARYIEWARGEGCTAQSGIRSDEEGRVQSLTRIVTADKKKWVIVVGVGHQEHLAPTMVGYLDRRLGLTSPFASMPGMDADQG